MAPGLGLEARVSLTTPAHRGSGHGAAVASTRWGRGAAAAPPSLWELRARLRKHTHRGTPTVRYVHASSSAGTSGHQENWNSIMQEIKSGITT